MTDSTHASPTLKSPPSDLAGSVTLVADLAPGQVDQMLALMATYFEGVTLESFRTDLAEKDWAILLTDRETGRIRGFSTLMQIRLPEERASVFFSGDTIVDRDCWGQTELPRVWARQAFTMAAREPELRHWWFLISSGYKTYRFLPVFFREFWPRPEAATPPEVKALVDRLGARKFGRQYDAARGVIRFDHATPLRPGVAEVTEERRKDRYVAFFAAANPGHALGDELACITEVHADNLTPAGRRMLGWRA